MAEGKTATAWKLRPAVESDLPRLWTLDQLCFAPELAYSQREMRAMTAPRNAAAWLAESAAGASAGETETIQAESTRASEDDRIAEDGRVSENNRATETGKDIKAGGAEAPRLLGFIVVHCTSAAGHVITLDVHPEQRRQGLGAALLAVGERYCQRRGARMMRLETAVNNETAIRFYQRSGYRIARRIRGYYTRELDAWRMEKPLLDGQE